MKFEKALEAMRKGKKVKRARWSNSSTMWIEKESGEMCTDDKPCNRSLSFEEITADDWCVISDIPSNEAGLFDEKVKETLNKIGDDLYKKILGQVPYNNVDISGLEGTKTYDRIEITFKSGDAITYEAGEWDDYSFNGKAVAVKKNGAWIGIYNFDHVFCVELK